MNPLQDVPAGDPLYDADLPQAHHIFDAFIEALPPRRKLLILCDLDVDGLGAGAVLWHFLLRRGVDPADIETQHPAKGENAFTPSTRGYAARTHPRAMFVLDLGVSSRTILHEVRPSLWTTTGQQASLSIAMRALSPAIRGSLCRHPAS